MAEYLSTREASTLVGVAPSSIKRLADEGVLSVVRTAGGHRRYARASLEAFLRQREGPGQPFSVAWVERLIRADAFEIEAEMLQLRARLGSWAAVADEIGPVLSELGAAWTRGEISIADEHRAAECLSRVISRIGSAIPGTSRGPQGLLACADGDDHTLALSLAELCMREQGWTPVWLGRNTPASELVRLVRSGHGQLVAISASASSKGRRHLAATASQIGAACQAAGATLVLGGNGLWPETPRHGIRLRSFTEFGRLLAELKIVGKAAGSPSTKGASSSKGRGHRQ